MLEEKGGSKCVWSSSEGKERLTSNSKADLSRMLALQLMEKLKRAEAFQLHRLFRSYISTRRSYLLPIALNKHMNVSCTPSY